MFDTKESSHIQETAAEWWDDNSEKYCTKKLKKVAQYRRRSPQRKMSHVTGLLFVVLIGLLVAATTAQEACSDKYGRACKNWAAKKYCVRGHRYSWFMNKYCCKSCTEAAAPTAPSGPPVNECQSKSLNKCNQICSDTPNSYKCSCRSGYRLDGDRRTCIDIDECRYRNGRCSQKCTNTEGSYSCSCNTGYNLGEDKRTCIITGKQHDQECLDEYNRYRALHVDTPPLKWSETLAAYARDSASCWAGNGCKNIRRPAGVTTRRCWIQTSTASTCKRGITDWYNKIQHFDRKTCRTGSAGKFIEMIWDTTKEVGFGISHKQITKGWRSVRTYLVAAYAPQITGNICDHVKLLKHTCPQSHPYIFKEGAKCCKSDKEGMSKSRWRRRTCGGKKLNYRSSCCKDDEEVDCPGSKCNSNADAINEKKRKEGGGKPGEKKGKGEGEAPKNRVNIQKCLEAHNTLRAKHQNTKPLKWNAELAKSAMAWAVHSRKQGVNSFKHSKTPNTGENFYWMSDSTGTAGTCEDAAQSWYSEIKDYDYNKPCDKSKGVIGHFTQVVWRDTTEIGVGIDYLDGQTFIIAQYTPPGNYNMDQTCSAQVTPLKTKK